jgi:cellulose synthase/poly-beta-1,6-N-acetylglucosamine synthase-like glycosyltransferase
MNPLHVVSTVFLAVCMSAMTLVAVSSIVLKLWRHYVPENNQNSGHGPGKYRSPVEVARRPRYDHPMGAIMVCARHEVLVLRQTLEAAVTAAERYLGICLVFVSVSHDGDDDDTLAIAKEMQRKYPQFVYLVPAPNIHKKPPGLNEIRRYAHEVLGFSPVWWLPLDAEDRLKFEFLREVNHWFNQGFSIVQGPVQLINFGTTTTGLHLPLGRLISLWSKYVQTAKREVPSVTTLPPLWLKRLDRRYALVLRWIKAQTSGWWRFHNCMEYHSWFTSRMVIQSKTGVMPLGGNTLCILESVLEAVGGWEECLTEDCQLGMHASALGFTVKVLTAPDMASLEETPPTIRALIRQRIRWMQGFIEVHQSGVWKDLQTRNQRLFARYVLGFQYYQAFSGVLTVPLLLLVFTKVPVALAMFAIVPFGLSLINTGIDLVMAREFGRAFNQKIRIRDYAGLAVGEYPYQFLLSIAGVMAIVRHLRGITDWVKTHHAGAALEAGSADQALERSR